MPTLRVVKPLPDTTVRLPPVSDGIILKVPEGETKKTSSHASAPFLADLERLVSSGHVEDLDGVTGLLFELLSARYPDAETFLSLERGVTGSGPVIKFTDPELAYELLVYEGEPELDPEGLYTIVDLAIGGQYCGSTQVDVETELQPDVARDENENRGICATLAVAHSLVDNLQVVKESFGDVTDGNSWDSDFLKKVQRAAGRNRGVNWDELDDAHEADWNDNWDVDASTGWKYEDRDSCDDLAAWCKELERFVEVEDDDCILGLIRRKTDDRDGASHAVAVSNDYGSGTGTEVTYGSDAGGCYCDIKTVDTGRQDPKKDFKNVPRNPGKQTWRIRPNAVNLVAGSDRIFWTHQRFSKVKFRCWDEEPLNGAGSAHPGTPGLAMDD